MTIIVGIVMFTSIFKLNELNYETRFYECLYKILALRFENYMFSN